MSEYIEDAPPELTLKDYLEMLRRRKWVLLGTCSLFLAIGIFFVSTRIMPIFSAEAKLLVRTTSTSWNDPDTEKPLVGMVEPAQPEGVETQIEVLKSEPFVESALEKSGLSARTDPRRPQIEAERVGSTNVITVTVQSPDERLAALVANTLLDRYLEYTSENTLKQIQAAKQFLDPDRARAQQELARAERCLLEFRHHHGVAQIAGERESRRKAREELEKRQLEIRNSIARLVAELNQVKSQLERESAIKRVLVERQNPHRDELEAKIAELETARAVLLAEYREHSRMVANINAQINALQQRRAAEPSEWVIERKVPNPVYDQLRAGQMALTRQLDSLAAEGNQLSAELATIRKQLNELGPLEVQLAQLTNARDIAGKSFLMLNEKLEELAIRETAHHSTARILQRAEVSPMPVWSRRVKILMMAGILGLVLGLCVGFLQEHREDRVTTPEAMERMLGLPVLGCVPLIPAHQSPLMPDLAEQQSIADSYRWLRSSISFAAVDSPLRTILVTSVGPGEGKSLTAINLAVAMAMDGQNVILVDADLRRPTVHAVLNLPQAPGLSDVLLDNPSIEEALQLTQIPGLRVLTSGPLRPNPAELVNSAAMEALIEQLGKEAHVVIFDSPPTALVPDTQLLSAKVDGVLLVVDMREVRRADLKYTIVQFNQARAQVLGLACNKVSGNSGSSYRSSYYPPYLRQGYSAEEQSGMNNWHSNGREDGVLKDEKTRALTVRSDNVDEQ